MSTSIQEALNGAAQPVETPVEAPAETPAEPVDAVEPEKVKEPQEKVEPEAEPKAEEKPDGAMVPTALYVEARTKAKELEKRLEAAESKPPEPEPMPDILEAPDAVAPWVQKQIEEATNRTRLEMSKAMAVETYGEEAVNDALAAVQGDQATAQRLLGEHLPYKALVDWHKKQQVFNEIGPDPEAWKAAERAKIKADIEAEMAVKTVRATPSLATETNAGARSGPSWSGPTPIGKIIA